MLDPRHYDWNTELISENPRDWGRDEEVKRTKYNDDEIDEEEDWNNQDNHHEGM